MRGHVLYNLFREKRTQKAWSAAYSSSKILPKAANKFGLATLQYKEENLKYRLIDWPFTKQSLYRVDWAFSQLYEGSNS